MTEEKERFECVWGYDVDCPIRILMAKEREQALLLIKNVPMPMDKDMPKELSQFVDPIIRGFGTAMAKMTEAYSQLANVGPFCFACPKRRMFEQSLARAEP